MSLLAQIYSQMTGLRIGKPHICKKFFPLPEGKYITLQPISKNQPAKCYSYWDEVITLLKPVLDQNGIKIYQIGERDERQFQGTESLLGKTSICQAHYVIQNSLLHLSADSFTSHSSGYMGIPQVTVFGNTSPDHHGPIERSKAILIQSHRNSNNPSFGNDQTINLIPPEEIVNSALKHLGAIGQLNRRSLHFGRNYSGVTVEWVPDSPLPQEVFKDAPILARYDYHQEESILFTALQSRKLAIITTSDLSINPLSQLKENILGITLIVDKHSTISKDFIKGIKSLGIKCQFVSYEDDAEWLSSKRLELFELAQIHKAKYPTKLDLIESINNYTNSLDGAKIIENNESLWVRSNKYILSKGNLYVSYFNYLNNLPTNLPENNVMNFIDDPNLYRDLEHFYVFQQHI
jgi:hypothetical protein